MRYEKYLTKTEEELTEMAKELYDEAIRLREATGAADREFAACSLAARLVRTGIREGDVLVDREGARGVAKVTPDNKLKVVLFKKDGTLGGRMVYARNYAKWRKEV